MLVAEPKFDQPVSLADALRRFGLSLPDAHQALNEMKDRGFSVVKLYLGERGGDLDDLRRLKVTVAVDLPLAAFRRALP